MTIFERAIEATLQTTEVEDLLNTFDKLFDEINADPSDYDWEFFSVSDLQDIEIVRIGALGNLMAAAQDVDILHAEIDIDDFDFDDGISFDMTSYRDYVEEIEDSINNLAQITGLKIQIQK